MSTEYNPQIPKRYTRRNHDGVGGGARSYRIPLSQIDGFEVKNQGGEPAAFGELINHLGKLEDEAERLALEQIRLKKGM
ncbi:MAG: hypothetical protein MJ116_02800 [Lachnospiraceae bacterium]|nr:hypothetical protein [Lachnospiraceae bacterium]